MFWLRAGEGCPSGAAEWPRLDPGRFPLLRRCPWSSPHWRPIPWPNCGALAWRRRISTLLVDDLIRDILRWMVAPSGFQQSHCSDQWNALGSLWKQDFKFDPANDSELTASVWLATGKSEWEKVWRRFDGPTTGATVGRNKRHTNFHQRRALGRASPRCGPATVSAVSAITTSASVASLASSTSRQGSRRPAAVGVVPRTCS